MCFQVNIVSKLSFQINYYQFVFLLECILQNVFWELILGALGLSRLEELELGVETVKQRILTSTENEEQKSLLIEKERFILMRIRSKWPAIVGLSMPPEITDA